MDKYSYLANASPEYLENLYTDFKAKPDSVDIEFRKFFEGFDFAQQNYNGNRKSGVSFDEFKVYKLIDGYRQRGHLIANTNPLKPRKDRHANLELENFNLFEKDLNRKFTIGAEIGLPNASLEDIIAKLRRIYCGSFGFEYGYVRVTEEVDFFRSKIESGDSVVNFSHDKKEYILRNLNKAVVFEKFLGTKYIGEKRFSLEGGETTIPGLHAIIKVAADYGVEVPITI
jgi:2-oxoglutarate dehydrogenase E1 component